MINIKAAPSAAPQVESPQLPADNSAKSCDRPSISRKRKIVSRRREYVHARSGEEVPPEDGYSWRKYGQKNILGAKYPENIIDVLVIVHLIVRLLKWSSEAKQRSH
uniref:Putative ovule protein n=1 Tax=Solanum chacoense TaxID=4108 RepID=A0A0V0H886_SOLCH